MTNEKIFAGELLSDDELDGVSGGRRRKNWRKLRERYENHVATVKMLKKFMAEIQELLPIQKSQRAIPQVTQQNLQQMLRQATNPSAE